MKKSKVNRAPIRASYEKDTIYKILDSQYMCHVGFVHNNYPVVIPTLYGRKGDSIFIHGSNLSRMLNSLELGIDVCVSVANISGLVLAKSAFHHSVNYESVVIFGKGFLVEDRKKNETLKIISDHIIPNRWDECRKPSEKELKITKVIEIKIDEVSAKIRNENSNDEKADEDLNYWSGVLPIIKTYDKPIANQNSIDIELPLGLKELINNSNLY